MPADLLAEQTDPSLLKNNKSNSKADRYQIFEPDPQDEYRRLLDYSEQVYFALSMPSYSLIDYSQAGRRIFDREGLSNANGKLEFSIFVDNSDVERVKRMFARSVESGRPETFEFRMLDSDNDTVWVRCRIVPRSGTAGDIIALDGFLQDISSSKLMEENIILASANLHQSRQLFDEKDQVVKQLLDQKGQVREETHQVILDTIKRDISPALDRLINQLDGLPRQQAESIRYKFSDLIASFTGRLLHQSSNLSGREMELCDHLKEGFSTEEIAGLMNISVHTIYVLRKRVRTKLDLTNQPVNLVSYLRNI